MKQLAIIATTVLFTSLAFATYLSYQEPYSYLGKAIDPHKYLVNICGCDKNDIVEEGTRYSCPDDKDMPAYIDLGGGTLQYVSFVYRDLEEFSDVIRQAQRHEFIGQGDDPVAFWFSVDDKYLIAIIPNSFQVIYTTIDAVERALAPKDKTGKPTDPI